MSLRKYLLAGGLSTVLVLGACNGGGDSAEEDDAAEEESAEEGTSGEDSEGSGSGDELSFSGEYGDYTIAGFDQLTLEETGSGEEETEEGEEAGPADVVMVEFEFTNNSDVPTSPEEAFGLDFAVRQLTEESEITLENLTMDLPDDHENSEEISAAGELLEQDESATAIVAYGPLDTGLETVLESRENPALDDELDHTIEEIEAGDDEDGSGGDGEE